MDRYKNIDGDSGVYAYECGPNYIDVQFISTGKIYRYSYRSAGAENVEYMKALAKSGNGLNAFINKYVRDRFEKGFGIA